MAVEGEVVAGKQSVGEHKARPGRPFLFKTPASLKTAIDSYFADCDPHMVEEQYCDYPFQESETETELEAQPHGGALQRQRTRLRDYSQPMQLLTHWIRTEQKPYTMAGLALWLGVDRNTLLNYEGRGNYSALIKIARSRVEAHVEVRLLEGKAPAGAIFNLKNNFGWVDRSEIEHDLAPVQFTNDVPRPDTIEQ